MADAACQLRRSLHVTKLQSQTFARHVRQNADDQFARRHGFDREPVFIACGHRQLRQHALHDTAQFRRRLGRIVGFEPVVRRKRRGRNRKPGKIDVLVPISGVGPSGEGVNCKCLDRTNAVFFGVPLRRQSGVATTLKR
jgi:hypothetical protein